MGGSEHISRNLRGSTPLNASAPSFTPPLSQAQAVEALLASGSVHVHIRAERENSAASPDCPLFLKGVRYDLANSQHWYGTVLAYLTKRIFVFASTTDVTYGESILRSAALPHIYNAVTKVEFPRFYWFGGVTLDRYQNPYLQMCRNLPNLRELSVTFHTAGITKQRWAEHQLIVLERTNPDAAKEYVTLSLREMVHRYDLDVLFTCSGLRQLRMEYIESAMIANLCVVGHPVDVLRELKVYLGHGFAKRNLKVTLDLVKVSG